MSIEDIKEEENIVHVFQTIAKRYPTKTAYSYLNQDLDTDATISFQDLDTYARNIANQLENRNLSKRNVLLIYPPGIEFISAFWGCLYSGTVIVPMECPNLYNLQKIIPILNTIIIDADISAILTTSQVINLFEEQNISFGKLPMIDSTKLISQALENHQEAVIAPDNLALLLYTSGSTASPKGVVISYGNLLHSVKYASKALAYSNESVTLTWLPHSHAFGLFCLIVPLYTGSTTFIMPPAHFVMDPFSWIIAISKYKVSHSGCPNFGYQLCIDKIISESLASINLTSWQFAMSAGEPVQWQTLQSFYEKFHAYGFQQESYIPFFGMTEFMGVIATPHARQKMNICKLSLSHLQMNDIQLIEEENLPYKTVVSCGELFQDTDVKIMDPALLIPVSEGKIGEIWAASPSLCQGYWNREEDTREKLVYLPTESKISAATRRYLRTGDLGFMLNNQLFITGRLKELIIINGKNYYPMDIERAVTSDIPALQQQIRIVFGCDIEGKEEIIVAQEIPEQTSDLIIRKIVHDIRNKIALSMNIIVYSVILVKTGTLQRTLSGKIQRLRCREDYLNGKLIPIFTDTIINNASAQLSASSLSTDDNKLFITIIESELNKIILSFLKLNNVKKLDIHQNIFEMGLTSISLLQLLAIINQKWKKHLSLEDFYHHPTLEQLATLITTKETFTDIQHHLKPTLIHLNENVLSQKIVCIHPIGGHAVCYTKFATLLKDSHSVYGIESIGLYNNDTPLRDVHLMAKYYINELNNMNFTMPYTLLGWSMGGVIAFEMAQQLNDRGESTNLILVDAWAPSKTNINSSLTESIYAVLIADMLTTWLEYMGIHCNPSLLKKAVKLLHTENQFFIFLLKLIFFARHKSHFFNAKTLSNYMNFIQTDMKSLGNASLPLAHIIVQAKSEKLIPQQVEEMVLLRSYEVFRANAYALAQYQCKPYNGSLTLFRSKHTIKDVTDDLGWRNYCSSITSIDLPCDHFAIFKNDYALKTLQTYLMQLG